MPGVICDQRTAARVKAKVYKLAGRPATMCGLETVALTFLVHWRNVCVQMQM